MPQRTSIITIGLSPAWDITCRGRNLDWGSHQFIDEQTTRPAGKALNVSKALAWMGQRSIAAGLWGRDDYPQMLEAMKALKRELVVKMTAVAGATRRNVTIVDTANNRDMHLRNESRLASKKALRQMQADLQRIVSKGSICVFAGTMDDGELLEDVIRIVRLCASRRAKIVLDTSGRPLRRIVDTGVVWMIKPNVAELCELAGREIGDTPAHLARAGAEWLDKVEVVLISRGSKGSVLVTREGTWQSRCIGRKKVVSTVGCGDFLLAGFLKGLKDKSDAASALETATEVAGAKAYGLTESKTWLQVKRQIQVRTGRVR
ncbi:MAG: PfkB family carbohydrate kinase [Planctomycetota bacterium]